jgi:hypothetical protein
VPPRSAPPPEPLAVRIWVADHPRLPRADALAGCRVWAPVGLVCAITDDPELADIRVHALDGPCVRNEDGRRTLAVAYSEGHRVEFNTRCFMDGDRFDAHMFRAVMGHEIGHELGIWTHVPEDCEDGDVRAHPAGRRVCGQAIMNPYYDKDVHFMTPIDALAFDLRDLNYAAVEIVDPPPVDAPDGPSCVYRTGPGR